MQIYRFTICLFHLQLVPKPRSATIKRGSAKSSPPLQQAPPVPNPQQQPAQVAPQPANQAIPNSFFISQSVIALKSASIPPGATPGTAVTVDSGTLMSSLQFVKACVPLPPPNQPVPPNIATINNCVNALMAAIPDNSGPGIPCTLLAGVFGSACDLIVQNLS